MTVDTGGTKTLVASFTLKGGKRHSVRFETPKNQFDYLRQLTDILQAEFNQDMTALSIAVPALLRDDVIERCGNLPWENFDLVKQLSATFTCPILIHNDAKMAALGEARALPEPNATCLYVTVSTGIGTGLVANGKLVEALSRSEGGHMVLEKDGIYQRWEVFASGKAIVARYGKRASDIKSPRIWNQIADDIALGLQALIPSFTPDYVVIGGSIGTHFDKFGPRVTALMKERFSGYVPVPKIIKAAHPEEAVVYGCYHYAHDFLAA